MFKCFTSLLVVSGLAAATTACSAPRRIPLLRGDCRVIPSLPGCLPILLNADKQISKSADVVGEWSSFMGAIGNTLDVDSGDNLQARYRYTDQKERATSPVDWNIRLTNPSDTEVRLKGRLCDGSKGVTIVERNLGDHFYIVDCIDVNINIPPGTSGTFTFAKSIIGSGDISFGGPIKLCFAGSDSGCIKTKLLYYTH